MNFTEEKKKLHDDIRDFVERELNPHAAEWEKAGEFPAKEIWQKLGKAGFLGISKPKVYGGRGENYFMESVATDALNFSTCEGLILGIIAHTNMCTPALAQFGSQELKQEFLAPAISGEAIACVAVTEESAGSDVANIKTQARPDGDDLIINGTKMWAGNCTYATWCCLLAQTSDDDPHKNKSLICVNMDEPGISISEPFKKLGGNMWPSAFIEFKDVRVPKKNIIGEEGNGFTYQMLQFQEERLCSAVSVLRSLQNLIDQTVEWTKNREIFGHPLSDNQYVHFRLAELQTELDFLSVFTWSAVECYVRGDDVTKYASMAKLKAGRLAREITDSCLQFWGGRGYLEEYPPARMYRGMRAMSIAGGSDETMLSIIAKHMGTLPRRKS
jgi:citronellyl-CoA dehydrogenase